MVVSLRVVKEPRVSGPPQRPPRAWRQRRSDQPNVRRWRFSWSNATSRGRVLAHVRIGLAEVNHRLDRMDGRFECIERRFYLAEAPPSV